MSYNRVMRFTLDGEDFELTSESVRAHLEGHVPEEIREYWVDIDGVRWPVKQVIATCTGAGRTRFQSQSSRRWLVNLGFVTGRKTANHARPALSHRAMATRTTFDAGNLSRLESIAVAVNFTWLHAGTVSLDAAGLPVFPALPNAPGIYRFDFGMDDEGVRVVYIGESVSLRRRASNYRNAKTDRSSQRTSRRIHKEVVAHLRSGGIVDMAIAADVLIREGAAVDLRRRSARLLAENAGVLSAQLEPGVAVLNIDADIPETESGGGADT